MGQYTYFATGFVLDLLSNDAERFTTPGLEGDDAMRRGKPPALRGTTTRDFSP